jgi:HPt (histidine-containing phosphotransfer) domain-containing protein
MDETNSFNPAAIERLCRLGGNKFAVEMIDLFFSYGGKKLTAAREAQQSGSLAALAEAAHPLKSSAGNVGAIRVQTLAAQLEQFALELKAAQAGTQLAELESAFAEVKSFLESEKARLAKSPS